MNTQISTFTLFFTIIAVLALLVWFIIWCLTPKNYTVQDFEAQLESDYYGPVPDDGLRCGIITPTESDFDRWLQDNVNPASYYLFSKISNIEDTRGVNFFKVQDGYHSNEVDLEVVRHAQMRIQTN